MSDRELTSMKAFVQGSQVRRQATASATIRRIGCCAFFTVAFLAVTPVKGGAFDVLTSRGDPGRTGANLRETLLTTENVTPDRFGSLFSYDLALNDGRGGGDTFAQPLVASHVGIPNHGVRNLVIVATVNNLVVALDADGPIGGSDGIVWKRELGTPPTIEQMLPGLPDCAPPTLPDFLRGPLLLALSGAPLSTEKRNQLSSALNAPPPLSCTNVRPQGHVGIMSTPVVDRQRAVIFLVARTRDSSGDIHHNLHALDLRTGRDREGSPVEIRGSASSVQFDPAVQNQRVGLALANGQVIVAFGSHEDKQRYHGWVMSYRYDDDGFSQTGIFVTTPTGGTGAPCNFTRNSCAHGGIWQTGRAPAIDPAGKVLLFVGNGKNDLKSDASNVDFGNSFLALDPVSLAVRDFYTPANHTIAYALPFDPAWLAQLSGVERDLLLAAQVSIGAAFGTGINELDLDLGGSGPMIIPDSPFVIGGGKQGVMHVWRLDSLGKFSATDASVVQKFATGDEEPQDNDFAGEDSGIMQVHDVRSGHIMGGPVYWPRPADAGGSLLFNWSEDSELRSYAVDPAASIPINSQPLAKGRDKQIGHPGGILTLSANHAGPESGIVWAATYDAQDDPLGALKHVRPGVLRAYAADSLTGLWNSEEQTNHHDRLGEFAKFVPPTVANGRVYMATFSNKLVVYGLRTHRYARAAAEVFSQAVLPLLDDPQDD